MVGKTSKILSRDIFIDGEIHRLAFDIRIDGFIDLDRPRGEINWAGCFYSVIFEK